MNNEDISDALNMLDDDIIEKTACVRDVKKKQGKTWMKWTATAACLALAVYGGIRLLPQEAPVVLPELPALFISEDTNGGMGYEAYMAYDASELISGNPWNEDMELLTLPVYKNQLTYHGYHVSTGADFDMMREFLIEIAGRLGLDADTLTIVDDEPDDLHKRMITRNQGGEVPEGYFNPTMLLTEADGLKLVVYQWMTAGIMFEPAISLPEEYNFNFFAPYEDVARVAEYLKNDYKDIIDIENPQTDIRGGSYDIYLRQDYNISFFDGSGSDTQRIINYNFNGVGFGCDIDGNLSAAGVSKPVLSQKMGDYPIISVDEATKALLEGKYIAGGPFNIPGAEDVAKVELIYRTNTRDQYFMPYYRFYVELPEEFGYSAVDTPASLDKNIKHYGAYYVPAVVSSYITNMPVWDGSRN